MTLAIPGCEGVKIVPAITKFLMLALIANGRGSLASRPGSQYSLISEVPDVSVTSVVMSPPIT